MRNKKEKIVKNEEDTLQNDDDSEFSEAMESVNDKIACECIDLDNISKGIRA